MAETGRRPTARPLVLIAGGGVAGLEAMIALRELAEGRVLIELLAPEPHFWYRPMAVAEPFGLGRVYRFELGALASSVGADFSLDALASVDTDDRRVVTRKGRHLHFDALLVALGAVPEPAIEGALTFRGPADGESIRRLLEQVEDGSVRRILFAAPPGSTWQLPLYELALLTKAHLAAREVDCEVQIVTPEQAPLAIFGEAAAQAISKLLEERDIDIRCDAHAVSFVEKKLHLLRDGALDADAVVALPALRGPKIRGLPADRRGFIPADEYGRVRGAPDVYAAGDATAFPIKQGGLAAQQADAAAQSIAADAGAPVSPQPFRAVLRGLLLTGGVPKFIRTDLAGWGEEAFQLGSDPLWWPPGKIAGRYLGPFLAEQGEYTASGGPPAGGIPVELDLGDRIEAAT